MENKEFKFIIEGDYVDSYIYSGFLFLVDSNYFISIYKWEKMFDEALSGIEALNHLAIRELIKDSRNKISTNKIKSLTVSEATLKKI